MQRTKRLSARDFIYEWAKCALRGEDTDHLRTAASVWCQWRGVPGFNALVGEEEKKGWRRFELYSYAKCIATVYHKRGWPVFIWRNPDKYSVTTSRHQTWMAGALSIEGRGLDTFETYFTTPVPSLYAHEAPPLDRALVSYDKLKEEGAQSACVGQVVVMVRP